jgi:selenocysteine-specific elongation factor
MIDARIHLARYATFEIKPRERVRVHHGAREVLGRVILLDAQRLRSAEHGLAQLRLEQPIVAARGDYIVLRKYSPSRVLGGGRIIDPTARKHKANDGEALEHLRIMEEGDSSDRLLRRLQTAGPAGLGVDAADRSDLDRLLDGGRIVLVDRIAFHRDALMALRDRAVELSDEYVKAHPLRYGIDKEELKERLHFPHATPTFNRVLEVLAQSGGIFVKGSLVRAGTETVQLSSEMVRAVGVLEKSVQDAAFQCRRETELSAGWKGSVGFAEALQFLKEQGRVHKIGDDLYMHDDSFESCLTRLREWLSRKPSISVPEFKELLGVTRKQAVPLLEYLDAQRYTLRRENVRVAGSRLSLE